MSSAWPCPAQILPRSPRLCNIHFADVFPRRMCVSSRKNEKSPSFPASERQLWKAAPCDCASLLIFVTLWKLQQSVTFSRTNQPGPRTAGGCKHGAKCAGHLWNGAALLSRNWRLQCGTVFLLLVFQANVCVRRMKSCTVCWHSKLRSPSGLIVFA